MQPPTPSSPSPPSFGPLLSKHPGSFRAGGWFWYLGGLLLAGGALGVAKAIKQVATDSPGGGDSILGSLAIAAVGAAVLLLPLARWRQRVTCYDQGLTWKRLFGTQVIRRSDVQGVRLIKHRGRYTNHDEIELETKAGTVSIVGVDQPEQLCNHLRAWVRGAAPLAHQPAYAVATANNQGRGGWTPPA